MPIPCYVEGDLRVQFLSSSLIRIEQKGPRGFEDRPTFTVVGREWKGVPFKKVGNRLISGSNTVELPAKRDGIKGIQVYINGKPVYTVGALPPISWLPAPAKTGPVWAMADAPRMVPPPGGAIPKNITGPYAATSGYDTGNNAPDLYLFLTQSPIQLRYDFLQLTGPIPIVPRYTFGFWDSRWFPYNDKMALASIDEYRKRGLPLDLFVCDTDWRVGASKGYGIDTKLFPNMADFLSRAHAKGVRVMFNDHPEPQAPTALDPKETNFRWNGLTDLLSRGLDVWWFDRNWSTALHEPMPGISKETWGASVFHDVTKAFRPDQPPLIMSNVDGIDNGVRNRPPHPAFHRYPITWTGDTSSTWTFLQRAVQNGVDEGVIGMLPYVHEDAGGHVGYPSPELYTRFMQYAALSPVMRVHCTYGLNRYPWSFGPAAEQAVVEAIRFRYKLIPTLYAAANEATTDGTPILRRLDLEWPEFPEAASSRQYLLGNDLLVSPVTEPDSPDLMPLTGDFHSEYFPNRDLSGEPVLTEEVKKVDVDWRQGSPGAGIPNDGFTARWTGKIGPLPRDMDYRFATSTDDGVRLWVDGKLIIDQWKPLDSVLNVAKLRLAAGKSYDIKMEFLEVGGGANAHLYWGGAAAPRSTPRPWTFWCPPGAWIDPWTGNRIKGPRNVTMPGSLRRVPMLVREGGMLLLGSDQVRNSDEQLKKPMTIETWHRTQGSVRRQLWQGNVKGLGDAGLWWYGNHSEPKKVSVAVPNYGQAIRIRFHLGAGAKVKRVEYKGRPIPYRVEKPTAPAKGLTEIFTARGGPVVEVTVPRSRWPIAEHNSVTVQIK